MSQKFLGWERVNRYLEEFGFRTDVCEKDFVPENMFYRLAMKASNEAAQKFQARIADEILPTIRQIREVDKSDVAHACVCLRHV